MRWFGADGGTATLTCSGISFEASLCSPPSPTAQLEGPVSQRRKIAPAHVGVIHRVEQLRLDEQHIGNAFGFDRLERGREVDGMETNFPECRKCEDGVLLPLSDYGRDGAPITYKAWVCSNPNCGFNMPVT